MAEQPKTTEEVAFEWDTAPEYVRIALRTVSVLLNSAGCDVLQRAKLIPPLGSMTHPLVMRWLGEHGYLRVEQGIAVAASMVQLNLAIERSGL